MATKVIDSLEFGSDKHVFTIPYGVCSTAAATAAKVVTFDNFVLETGAEISVKFTIANTAANPTLNVNSTGAKAIYYRGAAISAAYLKANGIYKFIYNGTQYDLVGDINTNSDTKNTAGSTDTSSKIFLIGATSQASSPQTYSDNEVYVTNGVLTTKKVQVGGTAATLEYDSTNKCINFVFA